MTMGAIGQNLSSKLILTIKRKSTVQQLAAEGVLHSACANLFQVGKTEGHPLPLHLYAHQLQALAKGQGKQSYVVTTGTGRASRCPSFIPSLTGS
jgi:ATP-dependent helicase YprA (DUF1998 family)